MTERAGEADSTTAVLQNQTLDPRLRRLVHSMDDPSRMRRDLDQAVVAASIELAADEVVRSSVLTTRVLVRARPPAPITAIPGARWIELIEGIYSVEVPVTELERLAALPQVDFVEAARFLNPLLDTSLAETHANRVHHPPGGGAGLTGTGVVVGIVDSGLDFTLDDFIGTDGRTRVAFLWDQFLDPQGAERSPARFDHGVEYDAAAINQALQAPNPFAVVRHRPKPASHGTHVTGIAAGNGRSADAEFAAGRFIGAAPGATIVFVQPDSRDAEGSFTDSVHVAEAIAYIFGKATELGMPCVINMSLGQNGGSHDGESIVERAIDRLLEAPGRAFVGAAGNEHIWRGHASGALPAGGERVLQWKAGGELPIPGGGTVAPGPGDFTPNELEIWYASRDVLNVRLVDPTGEATDVVRPGEAATHDFGNGNTAVIISDRFSVLNGDGRIYIEVSPGTATAERVATGVWRVELEAVGGPVERFDAWIERDVRDRENKFGDQSFFLGADFDEVMTLGTPATTRRGVAVANYDHVTVAPSNSSSRGRTRDGRGKPEVAAPGTNITSSSALGGRPAGPGKPPHPMRTRMSGTSMSAPHVAGIAALLLQRNPKLTSAQIRSALIASANPPAGVDPFDIAWGYGRVDAEATINLIR
jgi:subtilisin family serine protease